MKCENCKFLDEEGGYCTFPRAIPQEEMDYSVIGGVAGCSLGRAK